MRFESGRAFTAAEHFPQASPPGDRDHDLPPEIAFLRHYHVDPGALLSAAQSARRHRVCAARALIAEDLASAALYYRAFARHLDVPFVENWPLIQPPRDLPATFRAEAVRFSEAGPATWLVAPTDGNLRAVLGARALGIALPRIAITTPSHLSAIIQHRAQDVVEHSCSDALHRDAPHLSAKGAADHRAGFLLSMLMILFGLGIFLVQRAISDAIGLLFLAGIAFRLFVCMAGLGPAKPQARPMRDADLPFYTVLVPLHDEGGIVPKLVAYLRAIDYPSSKLEILMLVEPEDLATRTALAAMNLPPYFRVVVGPSHTALRTKPRALNIGLAMARGTLLTVYDAEDRPDPDQLRRAAAQFNEREGTLACVQAKLAVGNGKTGLLAKLFAIEYASLFDLYNIGTTALNLPLPLGGTSNHFRTSILRAVGGWDAWNVTEDADLGLRLARLGFEVETLNSTTIEAAPMKAAIWMKQRRRWTKGWMQTFLVLARDAPRVYRDFGWGRSATLVLMLINLVVGPLLLPVYFGIVAYHLATCGLPQPKNPLEFAETALDLTVFVSGTMTTLWTGYAGLRARQLDRFRLSLPFVLPYQLMVSAAAWMGLLDLIRSPYHWHKTPH